MKCSRMLSAVCVVLAISSVLSLPVGDQDLDSEFEEWKKKYGKVYSGPEEEAKRREIWEETKKRVEAHNKEADQGVHPFRERLTSSSDLTEEVSPVSCFRLPAKEVAIKIVVKVKNLTAELEPVVGNFPNVTLDGDVGKNSSMVPNVGELENQ